MKWGSRKFREETKIIKVGLKWLATGGCYLLASVFMLVTIASVKAGTSLGEFAFVKDLATDSNPGAIVSTSLDNDGFPDLVVANQFDPGNPVQGSLSIYTGLAGAFNFTVSSPAKIRLKDASGALGAPVSNIGFGPIVLGACDLNGDGINDIVIGGSLLDNGPPVAQYGMLLALVRNASGVYEQWNSTVSYAGSLQHHIEALYPADLDYDNDLDLVLLAGNTVVLMENDSSDLVIKSTLPVSSFGDPDGIAVTDWNASNSSKPDDIAVSLSLANFEESRVAVFINHGSWNFNPDVTSDILPNRGGYIAAADFNLSGSGSGSNQLPELLIGRGQATGNRYFIDNVFQSTSRGANQCVAQTNLCESSSGLSSMVVADFDGDRDVDVAYAATRGEMSVFLIKNFHSQGFVGVSRPNLLKSGHMLATADFDHDGDIDLVGTNPDPDTSHHFNSISFLENVNDCAKLFSVPVRYDASPRSLSFNNVKNNSTAVYSIKMRLSPGKFTSLTLPSGNALALQSTTFPSSTVTLIASNGSAIPTGTLALGKAILSNGDPSSILTIILKDSSNIEICNQCLSPCVNPLSASPIVVASPH